MLPHLKEGVLLALQQGARRQYVHTSSTATVVIAAGETLWRATCQKVPDQDATVVSLLRTLGIDLCTRTAASLSASELKTVVAASLVVDGCDGESLRAIVSARTSQAEMSTVERRERHATKRAVLGARCRCCDKPGQLRLCSGCHSAGYCGEACQKAHWKAHKKECKPLWEKAKETYLVEPVELEAGLIVFVEGLTSASPAIVADR